MNVDTGEFRALTERASAIGRLEETVAALARQVEHFTSFDAMLARARGGYVPVHAAPKRPRHLRVVR